MMKPSHVVALGLFLVSCGRPASGLSPGPATPARAEPEPKAGDEPPKAEEYNLEEEDDEAWRPPPRWIPPPPVIGPAFSPDSRCALSAAGGMATVWDLSNGRAIRTFGGGAYLTAVAFSPDGKRFLAGSPATPRGEPGRISLWDVTTGKRLRVFTPFRGGVHALAFSPDGRHALSCGTAGPHSLELWDVSTGKVVRSFVGHTDAVLQTAFSPDGR
jgi:WD40 repeat protein